MRAMIAGPGRQLWIIHHDAAAGDLRCSVIEGVDVWGLTLTLGRKTLVEESHASAAAAMRRAASFKDSFIKKGWIPLGSR